MKIRRQVSRFKGCINQKMKWKKMMEMAQIENKNMDCFRNKMQVKNSNNNDFWL